MRYTFDCCSAAVFAKITAYNGADIIYCFICTHQEHQRWTSGVCVVAAGADSGIVLPGARNDLPGLYSAGFFLLGLFFHISLVFFVSMRILPLFALQRHDCDGIFAPRRCCFCLCGKTRAVVLHPASTAAGSAVSCDFGTVLIIKR